MKEVVKKLVSGEQIQFVNGGWGKYSKKKIHIGFAMSKRFYFYLNVSHAR
jgi:hypothetical protein